METSILQYVRHHETGVMYNDEHNVALKEKTQTNQQTRCIMNTVGQS